MNNVKMLTIDLLKGQGIPVRSRPESIAATTVMLEVPAIIAIIMFGYYMHNRVFISIQKQKIVNYDARINRLSGAAAVQIAFEKEKENINGCLLEVAATINKHTQWTPVLVEVVKSMPDSILLTGIDVKQDIVKKKVLSKEGGGEKVVTVPIRVLQISARENSGFGYGRSIREFQDRLRSSALLSSRLDNINVSQSVGVSNGQDVVSYQINCAFKPGL
jgi:hypothetical protein